MSKNNSLHLDVTLETSPGRGLRFSLDENEINEIVQAHGYGPVEHLAVPLSGGGQHNVFTVKRGAGPDAQASQVRDLINRLLKKSLMQLMKSVEADDPPSTQ